MCIWLRNKERCGKWYNKDTRGGCESRAGNQRQLHRRVYISAIFRKTENFSWERRKGHFIFKNISRHQNHLECLLKHRWLDLILRVSDPEDVRSAWESASVTGSQGLLVLTQHSGVGGPQCKQKHSDGSGGKYLRNGELSALASVGHSRCRQLRSEG